MEGTGEGGTWVLRISLDTDEAEWQRCVLGLALSMEERCQVIQMFGGRYVEDASERPGLLSCDGAQEEARELKRLRAEGDVVELERLRVEIDTEDYAREEEEEELRKLQEEMMM